MEVIRRDDGTLEVVLTRNEEKGLDRYLTRKTLVDLAEMQVGGKTLPKGFWAAEGLVHELWERRGE